MLGLAWDIPFSSKVNTSLDIGESAKSSASSSGVLLTRSPLDWKQALGMFLVGTDQMEAGKYISEHDKKIANKLAYVMAGGDLSEATLVSEQYLLDLEREAFLSLTAERKSLERIQYMLTKGKPLRN